MKRTLISLLIVTLASSAVCIFSTLYISRVSEEIEGMRTDVLSLAEQGDPRSARLLLQQMAGAWDKYEPVLETLCRHDDLHEITLLISEADAHLSSGDPDDFSRSMALLGQAIRHLSAEEKLHLSNILSICYFSTKVPEGH